MPKISAALLLIAVSSPVIAAEDRKPPTPDIPAEKYYKNIQVLQGVPSTEVMPAMNFMKDALGVKCSYCHVTNDTGRWPVERDDKAAKGRAREMILMMREINKANFKGRVEVTCATCHHGGTNPVATPPLSADSVASHPNVSPTAPAADALLTKYTAAIGGKQAIEAVHTRRLRGRFTGGDGEPHPIEITQTASGQYRSSVTVEDGAFTMIFDGKAGTSGGPSWNNPMMPDEIERIQARARLFPAVDLKSRFPALVVRGHESVAGRDAWIVMGRDADGRRETFWFDAENGLLLRTELRQRTPLGDIPEQADYSDYRSVDGVKVPFTIRHTAPDRSDTIAATEIQQNAPIDDGSFQPRD